MKPRVFINLFADFKIQMKTLILVIFLFSSFFSPVWAHSAREVKQPPLTKKDFSTPSKKHSSSSSKKGLAKKLAAKTPTNKKVKKIKIKKKHKAKAQVAQTLSLNLPAQKGLGLEKERIENLEQQPLAPPGTPHAQKLGKEEAEQEPPPNPAPRRSAFSFATSFSISMEQKLVNFVKKTVNTLRFSSYKFGGKHFDTDHGVYVLDCSSYVDNVLENVYPEAYYNLINWSGSPQPTTRDYYQFFNNLSIEMDNYHWRKIEDIDELRGGDILVFRYKNKHGHETGGGHVMIIMDKPQRENTIVWLKVADSASARHSNDTRPQRTSGIGIGTLLLKVNPDTYEPSAYAWNLGAPWKNVKIAMARPAMGGTSA